MRKLRSNENIPGSFRDPSGFLFLQEQAVYRQINSIYQENYDFFISSGLYQELVDQNLLVPHEEADIHLARSKDAYKVIKPKEIPFVSYPYEWCFSQLRDAALATLAIQRKALHYNMSLKDCSAYNIQFSEGKPIFIDTLSFEKYREGKPWVAYRQFCQHFLAPLALMSYRNIDANKLLRLYIDGIPLDLASSLLPLRTKLRFSLLTHIHLHAKSQEHFSDKTSQSPQRKMSRLAFLGLLDSLESAIRKLKLEPKSSVWSDYYADTNYSAQAMDDKKRFVSEFLDEVNPKSVWDLGANTGVFSHIANDKGIEQIISFDSDPAAVEKNYVEGEKKKENRILPLVLDLTNPSPGIGWQNKERMSWLERGPAEAVMALALIHHLAIANNLPFSKIAEVFSQITSALIVEFVPKDDSQVQRLLATREDIFPDYNQENFEYEFKQYFTIQRTEQLADSSRILYLMQKI